ncbi:DUF803 domain protein membrane protein [Niveomyces insectorum RCEF 264]|uniref:DUF803 domain protein membrane protein n=1 Tax=Niveomyces insectorum RCEF 264 TaxID=1081102 RepID=A0A162MTN7_9HYPO|nr:DUF803 domain protein membrane protein [Niveomyces insectorum RCEF 264]
MENAAQFLAAAHTVYARANDTAGGANNNNTTAGHDGASSTTPDRPGFYKVVGICLAIGSGLFIGTSFVLKKVGLLKANEKYNEVAGEGYGYLKNAYWWSGMTLMIVGEICNFVAYAFTDAILVTPLGALSVVITTILSAIFLKERLSMIGKVSCFLCIVGSVVIVMNAPQESSVADIQEMQHFVVTPGFLTFAGVILVGSVATAFYAGPRWGKKNMLVYLSICSWVGGLSVVATQGLGSAIVAQAGGKPQFNQWFLYVLLVFVVGTLVTEIIFLNKALNLFNAAMVTPTYYVYFTSTTIITSAVLFQGFKGTVTSIVTVVLGFLTICSGVVLLQLSKSAKDVPDTAVFAGDLDQIHTIADQEQPETEPKADAIRGAAALLRRFSTTRQNMELAELKRLREEKMRERLEAVSEDGQPPQYEWDGLRRRRTTIGSQRSRTQTVSSVSGVGGFVPPSAPFTPAPPTPHPPLGWSHIPTEEELAAHDHHIHTPGVLSSIAGTLRGGSGGVGGGVRRGHSVLVPGHHPDDAPLPGIPNKAVQSPMHPVQLTEIAMPLQQQRQPSSGSGDQEHEDYASGYYGAAPSYGLPAGKTEYVGAGAPSSSLSSSSYAYAASDAASSNAPPPDPPPHSARRQFSFQNVFRRHQQHGGGGGAVDIESGGDAAAALHGGPYDQSGSHYRRPPIATRGYSAPHVRDATEEERLGLVKGDSRSAPTLALAPFDEEDELVEEDDDDDEDDGHGHGHASDPYRDDKRARYGRGITGSASSPPRNYSRGHGSDGGSNHSDNNDEKTWRSPGSSLERNDYRTHGRRAYGSDSSGGSGNPLSQQQQQLQQHETPPPPPPGGRRYSPPRGGDGAFI